MQNITKLENGLTIVTQNKDFNNLSIGIWVKAGLLTETPEINGISHFLEHMAFKGTTTKNAKELIDSIEQIGAQCNAYTSTDHTCYYVNLLPEYWKQGIDFLSDIVQNSTFPEEEIERERNVILQELKASLDDPTNIAFYVFMENVYKDQILGKKILGTEENIKRFTKQDFINYVTSGYVGDNMVISACGNIDHEEFVEYIKVLFKNLQKESKLTFNTTKYNTTDIVVEKDIQQAYLMLGLEGISMMHEDRYKLKVFNAIFNGGMSCRLFQEVREKHGLGYIITTMLEKFPDSGFISIFAGVEKEDLDKTIKVCKEVLNTMKTSISEQELEKAKNTILYGLAVSCDKCFGLAQYNAESLLFKGSIESFDDIRNNIMSLTVKDIYDFSNKYLNEKYATAIVKPLDK